MRLACLRFYWAHIALACIGIGLVGACAAQSVALSGNMGTRALLVIDGSPPKAVAPGETHRGVKLVTIQGDEAVIEINGQRQGIRIGEAPVTVGAIAPASSGKIVLHAQEGGHFLSQGSINGNAVYFLVDTGATTIALSVNDAERIRLPYKAGKLIPLGTANGTVQGWGVKLSSVRIGDVEIREVDAVVTPQPMNTVLLGNSFLSRFQMQQQNNVLTLQRRY